jgi:hypothetical protein
MKTQTESKNILADYQSSYDLVAEEYVRRIFDELQHKPFDRHIGDETIHLDEWWDKLPATPKGNGGRRGAWMGLAGSPAVDKDGTAVERMPGRVQTSPIGQRH